MVGFEFLIQIVHNDHMDTDKKTHLQQRNVMCDGIIADVKVSTAMVKSTITVKGICWQRFFRYVRFHKLLYV
jgi:hypothetical protein